MTTEINSAREILKSTCKQLLSRANVVATGIGYKVTAGRKTPTLSIICSVTEKPPAFRLAERDKVPASMDGIPTDILLTGPLWAQTTRSDRHRPAQGGVSIGHRDITAGTLGCLVKKNGVIHLLSNNHVLANSNKAEIGDPILQPGRADNGSYPTDHIADLAGFVPISVTGVSSECPIGTGAAALLNGIAAAMGSRTRLQAIRQQTADNLVDAAIARPLDDQDVSDEILEIGTIQGMGSGELGMAIKKSGRTTGLTTGEIQQIDVTANVQYGPGQIATFSDQLLAGAMSQGGDSGSAVLDNDNRLVGLLFAGSDTTTIINRIENVFSALDLTL
ncbi:MAG: hypothetical protein V3R65_09060 [Acidiferrobacterales bacterium]